MSQRVRLLSQFLKRLDIEGLGDIPITWLIGAGMSATSGIPLAYGVSQRIILFEYLAQQGLKPWPDPRPGRPYEARNVSQFFAWFDACEREQDQQFLELFAQAHEWLATQSDFHTITPDKPECYQLLFKHFFQSTTTHHTFLTQLISRAQAVNLAHLGLAGLLRDQPQLGHTVFTTNFDDLLLKAILSLNYTARVFGDTQSEDKPSLNPHYPQIVHLHGRHTGYRLLNTQEQISLIDPDMQEGFKRQIADSHLIILGYSGWDDLVMKTLEQWPKQPGLLRGNLYWVPYKSENNLLPQVRDFLDSCPPHQAQIIVDEDRSLNADSFMLALCDTLNREKGGFEPHRQGILQYATHQHHFILQQLEDHPNFDPSRALDLVRVAKDYCRRKQFDQARQQIEMAKKLMRADDLPDTLRGSVLLGIGVTELLLGDLESARSYLESALPLWDKVKMMYKSANLEKANTLRALGELYLKQGNVEAAKDMLKDGRMFYQEMHDVLGIGFTNKLIGDIALREGKIDKALKCFQDSLQAFREQDHRHGQAICLRAMSTIYLMQGNDSAAIQKLDSARSLFTEIGDKIGVAHTVKSLADVYIQKLEYERAKDLLDEAIHIYSEIPHTLGLANVENAYGDLYRQQNNVELAITRYSNSIEHYRAIDAPHGLSNALADWINCIYQVNVDAVNKNVVNELINLSRLCKNAYAWSTLLNLGLINYKTHGIHP